MRISVKVKLLRVLAACQGVRCVHVSVLGQWQESDAVCSVTDLVGLLFLQQAFTLSEGKTSGVTENVDRLFSVTPTIRCWPVGRLQRHPPPLTATLPEVAHAVGPQAGQTHGTLSQPVYAADQPIHTQELIKNNSTVSCCLKLHAAATIIAVGHR